VAEFRRAQLQKTTCVQQVLFASPFREISIRIQLIKPVFTLKQKHEAEARCERFGFCLTKQTCSFSGGPARGITVLQPIRSEYNGSYFLADFASFIHVQFQIKSRLFPAILPACFPLCRCDKHTDRMTLPIDYGRDLLLLRLHSQDSYFC
jgi:hypothetical protein